MSIRSTAPEGDIILDAILENTNYRESNTRQTANKRERTRDIRGKGGWWKGEGVKWVRSESPV